jgi:lipopolysaccharide export LptBFGC system permease protein LptF
VPIPPGIEPAYVWCLFWFGFAGALAGLITQQMGGDELRERVRARTYARLGRLNEVLTRRIDAAWKKTPTDDIVPDLDELRTLKAEIERAAALDHAYLVRARILGWGRLASVLELILAALAAVAVAAFGPRQEFVAPALFLIVVGCGGALVSLVVGAVLAVRIEHGNDYL